MDAAERTKRLEMAGEKAERDAAARRGELKELINQHLRWLGWTRKDLGYALKWSQSQVTKKLIPGGSITWPELMRVADILRIHGDRRRRFRELLGFPVDPELEHPTVGPQVQHEEMLKLLKEMRDQLARDVNRQTAPQPDWSLLARTLLQMFDRIGFDIDPNLSYIENALTLLEPATDKSTRVIRGRLHAEHLFWMVLKHLPTVAHHIAVIPGAAEIQGFTFRPDRTFVEGEVGEAMVAEGEEALGLLADAEDHSEVDYVVRFVGITMATVLDVMNRGGAYDEDTARVNKWMAPFGLRFRAVGDRTVRGGRVLERIDAPTGAASK